LKVIPMLKKPTPSASAAAKSRANLAATLPMPELPAAFVFYDTETSGLSKTFGKILQIAAVRTDGDLNIGDEAADSVVLRARRLPWVVPSPAAMVVTRLTPTDLEVQPLSSYELLATVTNRFEAWSPAIFIGHNTIRYDEEMLRHGLFSALQDPYITQLNGNMRADTLIMLHAVFLLSPGSVNVPMVPTINATASDATAGDNATIRLRPSFRLGDIARANGITLNETEAHDARTDVIATIEVARLIRDKAPDIFRLMLANASKAHVLNQLQQPWLDFDAAGQIDVGDIEADAELESINSPPSSKNGEYVPPFDPLLLGHIFGANAKLTPVLFISTLPDNKNATVVIDLTLDPDDWLNADAAALAVWMEEHPRAFQKVKINAFPILAPFSIAAHHGSSVFMDMCKLIASVGTSDPFNGTHVINGDVPTSIGQGAPVIDTARTVLAERMLRIMAHLTVNPDVRGRVLSVFASRQKTYPLSPYIEENLYSGFPSTADRTLAHRMQAMSIAERVRHIPMLQDARLREHAWRWIFADNPEALPPEERLRLTEWLHQRIRGNGDPEEKLPYLTISKALEAVAEMHESNRDEFAAMSDAERTAAMQRLNALLDYFVFINESAQEMLEQQKALIRATNAITSGFDGIIPAKETIRTITGVTQPRRSRSDAPPHTAGGAEPFDPDIDF
jgi:exodeoxyribonuclease I